MKAPWSEPTITRTNALLFLLWCAIALAALTRHIWLGPIEVLFLLAPLVHVPLGLRVVLKLQAEFSPLGRIAIRLVPIGAIAAAVSFWPRTGLSAGFLAAGWFFVCLLLAAKGLMLFFRGGYRSAEGICISVGLLYLAVGGVWLVLSRSGATPMHFAEPIILLTAVHFHFTGFALPVIAAATGSALANRAPRGALASLFPYVTAGIVSGPAILAGGFVFGYPLWKLLAALFLATVCIVLAALLFSVVPRIEPRSAQILLCISASSLIIGMVLAGAYVVGDFTQRYWLLIPRMARLHGTTNALGFAFCGLLGWAVAYGPIQRPASPSVDSATTHSSGPYGAPGRTVAAFLIAPLTVPVLFNGIAVLSDVYTSGASPSRLLDGVLFSLYTLPFAYFAELVLGVPVWLAFKYFRIRSFSAFAAGGALIGLLFCAIWDWPANFTLQSLAQAFDPFWLAIFVIPASASATLFRAIAFSKPKRLLSS
jgi:hypothetical protein